MAAVDLVELGGAQREHRAALQHLHLHAHLEHVGRRRHRHVGQVGLARASLLPASESPDSTAAWLTEPVSDVGGAERERRRHRRRRAQPARRADPDRPGIAVTRRELVAQREDRGQQRDERPVVGVAAAVGLDGDVLGDGHASRELGLRRVSSPRSTSARSISPGGGDMNCVATSGARDLREDVVPPHDRARPADRAGARRRAAHHGGREAP